MKLLYEEELWDGWYAGRGLMGGKCEVGMLEVEVVNNRWSDLCYVEIMYRVSLKSFPEIKSLYFRYEHTAFAFYPLLKFVFL